MLAHSMPIYFLRRMYGSNSTRVERCSHGSSSAADTPTSVRDNHAQGMSMSPAPATLERSNSVEAWIQNLSSASAGFLSLESYRLALDLKCVISILVSRTMAFPPAV